MFIRKTTTRNKSDTESYFTFRLVPSERTGDHVRQLTLLNLGRHFDLPQTDWPRLCDAGIAAQANVDWLVAPGYRHLVVSRERSRQFDPERVIDIKTASQQTVS